MRKAIFIGVLCLVLLNAVTFCAFGLAHASRPHKDTIVEDSFQIKGHQYYWVHQSGTDRYCSVHNPECDKCYAQFD